MYLCVYALYICILTCKFYMYAICLCRITNPPAISLALIPFLVWYFVCSVTLMIQWSWFFHAHIFVVVVVTLLPLLLLLLNDFYRLWTLLFSLSFTFCLRFLSLSSSLFFGRYFFFCFLFVIVVLLFFSFFFFCFGITKMVSKVFILFRSFESCWT